MKESNLELTHHLVGGSGLGSALCGMSFSDVSDRSNVRKAELSWNTEALPSRYVFSGTNVECRCPCTPDYNAIREVGLGTVELAGSRLDCPVCYRSSKLVPVTVGLNRIRGDYIFYFFFLGLEEGSHDWELNMRVHRPKGAQEQKQN